MKEQPQISIIVPVYNSEKYLEECIESVLNQSYKNIELILINDGSTDDSYNICKKYLKYDSRVKVIDKENQGVSIARNEGIRISTGKYIIFMDSDDFWIGEDSLKEIIESFRGEPDVALFGSVKYLEKSNIFVNDMHTNVTGENKIDIFNSFSRQGIFLGGVWDKIIKRSLIVDNLIYFNNDLISSEDIDWNMEVIMKCKKVQVIDKVMYGYRKQNEASVTSRIRKKNIEDLFFTIKKWSDKGASSLYDENISSMILEIMSYEYSVLMALVGKFKKQLSKEFINEVKSYKWLLNYKINPKVKKVSIVKNIFGFMNTCSLLALKLSIRKY